MQSPTDLLKTKHKEVFLAWRNAVITPLSLNLRADSHGVTLLCVTRNEGWRLPRFLKHYRNLGIERFVFIDNDSEDNSRSYLAFQPGVDSYLCRDPFSTLAQRGWMQQMMERYGYRKWYLATDADEFLVFDGMEKHSLNELADRAFREGNKRVRAVFVDMYGEGPLSDYAELDDFEEVQAYCRFFDQGGYAAKVTSKRISVEGGPRKRMFLDVGCTDSFPEMTKYPLFFLEESDVFSGAHQMLPEWKNFVSECVLGILHYKFSKYDLQKIEEAVRRMHHWNGSAEYKCYARWFEKFPNKSLKIDASAEYLKPDDLIRAGLITNLDWASRPGKSTVRGLSVILGLTKTFQRQRMLNLLLKKRKPTTNLAALVAKLPPS